MVFSFFPFFPPNPHPSYLILPCSNDIDTFYQRPPCFMHQTDVHVYIQTIHQSKTAKSNRLARPTSLFFASKTVVVTLAL